MKVITRKIEVIAFASLLISGNLWASDYHSENCPILSGIYAESEQTFQVTQIESADGIPTYIFSDEELVANEIYVEMGRMIDGTPLLQRVSCIENKLVIEKSFGSANGNKKTTCLTEYYLNFDRNLERRISGPCAVFTYDKETEVIISMRVGNLI